MNFIQASSGILLAMLSTLGMAGNALLSDQDHDGVPDIRDLCPHTPALRKYNPASRYAVLHSADELASTPRSVPVDASGCALDSDRDGVPDYKDYCPDNSPAELAKGIHPNGCPLHSDGDGTPDYRDHCPDTPRGIKTDHLGCPVS